MIKILSLSKKPGFFYDEWRKKVAYNTALKYFTKIITQQHRNISLLEDAISEDNNDLVQKTEGDGTLKIKKNKFSKNREEEKMQILIDSKKIKEILGDDRSREFLDWIASSKGRGIPEKYKEMIKEIREKLKLNIFKE